MATNSVQNVTFPTTLKQNVYQSKIFSCVLSRPKVCHLRIIQIKRPKYGCKIFSGEAKPSWTDQAWTIHNDLVYDFHLFIFISYSYLVILSLFTKSFHQHYICDVYRTISIVKHGIKLNLPKSQFEI